MPWPHLAPVSAGRSGLAPEKLDRVDPKSVGDLLQGVDGWRMLAAFKHANIIAVEVRTMSKVLLRNAFGIPNLSQVSGDQTPQIHAETSPCSLI